MPTNIEIKARVRDFPALQGRAASLSDTPVQVIPQEDTFFHVPQGRLKLRRLAPDHGQLVHYQRTDQEGPKRSDYHIFETSDPESLLKALGLALGVRGIVKKVRYLYMAGQTRIHLDDVEGLGQFMELEVVLQPGQDEAEGQAIAEALMEKLGVLESELLECAYMDLLENQ
jgi:predicted adenylyl cyclase CyaB